MKIDVTELLKKEMTRTEFLGLVGAGILSMIGISALMKNLANNLGSTSQPKPLTDASKGYGQSTYGG